MSEVLTTCFIQLVLILIFHLRKLPFLFGLRNTLKKILLMYQTTLDLSVFRRLIIFVGNESPQHHNFTEKHHQLHLILLLGHIAQIAVSRMQ